MHAACIELLCVLTYVKALFQKPFTLLLHVYLLQTWVEDVEDELTLKAVEETVSKSTSVKRIAINCRTSKWANVAAAILRGAAENKSLKELILQAPMDSSFPQDVVNEVKQKRSIILRVNEEWLVSAFMSA